MIIEVKKGLMWLAGKSLNAPEADEIAYRAGCNYAERFVRKYDGRLVELNAAGAVIRTRKPPKTREKFFPVGFYGGGVAVKGDKITLHSRRTVLRAKGVKFQPAAKPNKWNWKLKPASAKRAALNLIYEAQKAVWWPLHPRCEFVDPATGKPCHRKSSPRPHHKKKRGRHLCDVKSWMATCEGPGSHHDRIHRNEKEAKALGYLLPPDPLTGEGGQKLPPIITPLDEIR